MAIKIKPGVSPLKIRGMPESRKFQVSFVSEPYSYPERPLPPQDRGDIIVHRKVRAYSTTGEVKAAVVGDLTGLKFTALPGAIVERPLEVSARAWPGGHIQNLTSPRLRVRVETAYGYQEHEHIAYPSGYENQNIVQEGYDIKPGTVQEDIWANMLAYLPPAGASNETSHQFLDGSIFNAGYVVAQDNPNFTFRDIDWSGISASRSGSGSGLPYMLVSPRHAVFAGHVDESTVGDLVTFRRPDGSTQTVTVLARAEVPRFIPPPGSPDGPAYDDTYDHDMALLYFDAPVTGCCIFKMLPTDWDQYLPTCRDWDNRDGNQIPVPMLARMSNPGGGAGPLSGNVILTWGSPKFLVGMLAQVNYAAGLNRFVAVEELPENPILRSHYRAPYGGDSSSPYFFLIREQAGATPTPVLVGPLHAVGAGVSIGPALTEHRGWIQSNMDAMVATHGGMQHQLLTADLTRFVKFPVEIIGAGSLIEPE